jgi:hypothetical protein
MNRGSNYEVGDLVRYRRSCYDKMSEWKASRVGLIQDAPYAWFASLASLGLSVSCYTYSVLWSDRPIPKTVSQWDIEVIYEEPR